MVNLSIKALKSKIDDNKITISDIFQNLSKTIIENASLNALQSVDQVALKTTDLSNPKGKLAGIPFVAKDNINTNSLPTSGGTLALKNHIPEANAPVIDALIKEGAILIGKAGMHELAFGITSNNAAMGAIHNPHDTTRIPGGSSGGTAAAVASGIVPFGLGTDTGGSCRIPAALCGVVGFRPSTSRYSSEGIIPISHTRDTAGPIAHTVEDIILLDSILAQDAQPIPEYQPSNIRLGVDRTVLCADLSSEVKECFEARLVKLQNAGIEIVEIDLTAIWEHNAAFSFTVVLYEVMRDLPAYLKQYAPSISFQEVLDNIQSPDVLGALQSQLGEGAVAEAVYQEALHYHRPKMAEIYEEATKNVDAIIFPTTPLQATKIGEDETVSLNGVAVPTFPTFIRNTDLGSNLGVPGISLPAYIEGLPIGIEIDGKAGQDEELLAMAKIIAPILKSV